MESAQLFLAFPFLCCLPLTFPLCAHYMVDTAPGTGHQVKREELLPLAGGWCQRTVIGSRGLEAVPMDPRHTPPA